MIAVLWVCDCGGPPPQSSSFYSSLEGVYLPQGVGSANNLTVGRAAAIRVMVARRQQSIKVIVSSVVPAPLTLVCKLLVMQVRVSVADVYGASGRAALLLTGP